jgi:hypothetical protein
MACQYKNIFGEVGKGIHSYRVFDIAIVDVLLTLLLAYLISIIFPGYSYLLILILLFILGILLHRIFCVRTTVDKMIF